jgi:hypothetical protein
MTDHTTAPSARKPARRPQTPEATHDAVLLRLGEMAKGMPTEQDIPDRDQILFFFARLSEDYQAWRALNEAHPESRRESSFWDRTGRLYRPILEAWETWRTEPTSPHQDAIEQALVAFWLGFGSQPFSDVCRAVSPETLATWQVIQKNAEGIEKSQEKSQHFMVPRVPADLFAEARSGHFQGLNNPAPCPSSFSIDSSAFSNDLHDLRYWRFRSARGMQAAIGVTGTNIAANFGVHAREVFSGGLLRLWLATWILASERNDPEGVFEISPKHVICELFGKAPQSYTGTNGRRYEQAPRSLVHELTKHIAELQNIYLSYSEDHKFEAPQRLIHPYVNARNDPNLFRHAPLAWKFARMAFTKVPRALLQLGTKDVPLGLGVVNLWRARITSVLRGVGHFETSMQDLARQLGEDFEARARREGRAYWGELAQRLQLVLCVGDLGTLHVEGEGQDARAILSPSETLVSIYRPLAQAADRRRTQARQIEFETAVQQQLLYNRKNRKK